MAGIARYAPGGPLFEFGLAHLKKSSPPNDVPSLNALHSPQAVTGVSGGKAAIAPSFSGTRRQRFHNPSRHSLADQAVLEACKKVRLDPIALRTGAFS
jgi:hypothetical protein